jgi:uncharacterized membrane protein
MNDGWLEFVSAYAAFVLAHAVPVRPAARRHLVGALGERPYLWLHSALSLLLLGWLIVAAGRASYVPLWDPAARQHGLALAAMLLACLLFALGIGKPNPLSLGGGDPARFDPKWPGIVGVTRHPVLAAVALWAAAHLVVNGDLAHLLLFGGFLTMAVAGMVMLDCRSRRRLGAAAWEELTERRLSGWQPADLVRLLAGLFL